MSVPAKYLSGLSEGEKRRRIRRIREGMRSKSGDPRAYRPFPTDRGKKTTRSRYTAAFERRYSERLKGLRGDRLGKIAKVTRIPYKTLKTVYDRGLAAWRTGHRPGASQQAWGWARVYSFVMRGKTYYTADADLKQSEQTH